VTNEYETEYQNVICSVEAEQSLIGGLLIDQTPIGDVMDIITTEDFFVILHRLIWGVITATVDDSGVLDMFIVAGKLSDATGGENHLPSLLALMDNSVGSSNAMAYARVIIEKSLKRKTLEATNSISRYVTEKPQATIDEVTEYAQNLILNLNDRGDQGVKSSTMNEALKRAVSDIDARSKADVGLEGLSTGMPRIDELTNGYKRGELIVLAARPSMGKSTIALQQAAHLSAFQHKRGLFFSLEVPERELTKKMIACIGKIDLATIKNPKGCREGFWNDLEKSVRLLKDGGLRIIDCPGIHINQIRSYSRKANRREKLDFIFIDHIHLVRADAQSRERELAIISGSLKTLAIELDIPVIALAQLSRKVEERSPDNRRPMMSDLRDSGAIEQDADIIQFVYRDDYYNQDGNNQGLVEILQRKNRNGELGDAYFDNFFNQSRVVETNRYPNYTESKKSKGRTYD
jgi:replicative DNA helicase